MGNLLDPEARALVESILADLRTLAVAALRSERADHTLQPTALVNEVWLRLARPNGTALRFSSRSELLALAASVIRHVLVDHARRRNALKRGGGLCKTQLDDAQDAPTDVPAESLLGLDEELHLLARLHPRSARVVELRFFGGLTDREIADHLGVSDRTVRNDWTVARAWLRTRLADAHT